MTTYKVGYLIGSLARGSINRKLAKALVLLAPPELHMMELPFAELPLYSYDRAFLRGRSALATCSDHPLVLSNIIAQARAPLLRAA